MIRLFLIACLYFSIATCRGGEINYLNCQSLEEVIIRETQEILDVDPLDHEELANIYISRAESYLLKAEYKKAIYDFHSADYHLQYFQDKNSARIIQFRIIFGEVICYDNFDMFEETEQAIQQLQEITNHIGCSDCLENQPCQGQKALSSDEVYGICHDRLVSANVFPLGAMILASGSNSDYSDILGPDNVSPAWCEEIIVGVGRAMDAIACLDKSYRVKVTLIGIIEALVARGVKCCQTGSFWKACAAPIARKWQEWKNNKEDCVIPDEDNLLLFINGDES